MSHSPLVRELTWPTTKRRPGKLSLSVPSSFSQLANANTLEQLGANNENNNEPQATGYSTRPGAFCGRVGLLVAANSNNNNNSNTMDLPWDSHKVFESLTVFTFES